MGTFKVTTPALADPVTLQEAKDWAYVTISLDDALITQAISAATKYAETYCNRVFIESTLLYATDCFQGQYLVIPKGNITLVNSVTYYDDAEALQTVDASNYTVDYTTVYATIYLKSSGSWPSDLSGNRPYPINVSVTGGEADASDVADDVQTFIKMQVSDMYEHRETYIEDETRVNKTAMMLLNTERIVYV